MAAAANLAGGRTGFRTITSFALGALLATQPALAASPPRPAAASEPASVAHRIWEKLLTHCGESYFYAGSVFDGSGLISNVQVGHQKTLEFRGVRFNAVPIRVTDAERANGVQYMARITMIAHLYREQGEQWMDGPDLQPRNVDDMIGKAIGQANADMFDMGGSGAIALQLIKYKGTWAVTRSSTTLSGPLGFSSKYYDVDKLVAAKVARYSCGRSEVVQPTFTPAEIREATIQRSIAMGRTREQAEALYEASEASRQKIERDSIVLRDPKKGIPFVPVSQAKLDEIKGYFDERGFSRYINVKLPGGRIEPAEFHAFGEMIDRFPTSLSEGEWLAPGTTYDQVCRPFLTNSCGATYWSNSLRFTNKNFVIIKITSGPLAGQYALIDQANYHADARVVCPAHPAYPVLRC